MMTWTRGFAPGRAATFEPSKGRALSRRDSETALISWRFGRWISATLLAFVSLNAAAQQQTTWGGQITGGGYSGCYGGTFVVPPGVTDVQITAVGQSGSEGAILGSYSNGTGGTGGIVQAVVPVTPGQTLYAAPTSSLFVVWFVTNGGGAGGYASFVSTMDPTAYCSSFNNALPSSALLVVAGGGGGGASGGRGTGGSGGGAGPNGGGGGNGGNNSAYDGGGGSGGSQTSGGAGGAAGHSFFSGKAYVGGAGGYLAGGTEGQSVAGADDPVSPGGGGGSGYYGGGGGGGDSGGGGGGGGGGSNYLAPSIPTSVPASVGEEGTILNASVTTANFQYPSVTIIPVYGTATTISASPNPAALGQSVTITVNVSRSDGGTVNGGNVLITDGSSNLASVTVSGGVATYTTKALTPGDNYLQAAYQGNSASDQIDKISFTHGTNVGGVILPYDEKVGSTPPPVPAAPVITEQPYSNGTSYGSNCTFSNGVIVGCGPYLVEFTSAATGSPTPLVQWQISPDGATWSDLQGAVTSTLDLYNPPTSENGYKVRVRYTNASGTVYSTVVTMTVAKALLYITANNKTMPYGGEQPVLDVTYGNATYGAVFRDGDTPASLGGTLSCTVTPPITATTQIGSYPITCTGQTSPNYTLTYFPGTLTVQAAPQTITVAGNIPGCCTGKSENIGDTYQISATGGPSGNPLTYSLYHDTNSTAAGQNVPVCSVSSSGFVSFTGVEPSLMYGNCIVAVDQAGDGSHYLPATEVLLYFHINYVAPTVTQQPLDQSVAGGANATFTVAATAIPPPTVQWQVSSNGGSSYSTIAGATNTTLTLTNVTSAQDGNRYRAVASNNPNQSIVYAVTDAYSNAATLSVSGPPVVNLQPVGTTVQTGGTVTFTAGAAGKPTPTVQWQLSTNQGGSYANIGGATSTTLSFAVDYTKDQALYRAVFTNNAGTATTNPALLTVLYPPAYITQPLSQTAIAGQSVTFSVTYRGNPLPDVIWQQNVQPNDFSDQVGAGPTFTINNVTVGMSGNYYRALLDVNQVFTVSDTAYLTVVKATPTLQATASTGATLGASMTDAATLSGGYVPTGLLTFHLFDINDTTCSGAPVFTSVRVALDDGVFASGAFTAVAIGTYRWTVSYAGDANNVALSTACNAFGQNAVVGKASQTVFFGTPSSVVVNGRGGVIASSSGANSGNPIVYGTTTPAACSVDANTGVVTGLVAGTNNCTITADQAGDANYDAAPTATQVLSIGRGAQILSFTSNAPTNAIVGGTTYLASATSSAGLTPVVLSIDASASAVCTIVANTVSFQSIGDCVIDADQIGDANYVAATRTLQIVAVGPGSQTIIFPAQIPDSLTYVPNGTFPVNPLAAGGASTSPITYSSLTPTVCSVSAATVTIVNAGTCTLAADQLGDANYTAAAQVTENVAIGVAAQTIANVAPNPANPVFAPNGTFTVGADGGGSGNVVTFTIAAASNTVCSISGDIVTMLTAGTCSVLADQSGNTDYAAASEVVLNVPIAKATQTILFGAQSPNAQTFAPGGSFSINPLATGGASTSAVTYSSNTSGICSVSGSSVTILAVGTCAIAADQAGDANYAAATQATQNVAIGLAAQTISALIATPANPVFAPAGTFNVAASGGASGNAVTFTIAQASSSVCAIDATTVTILATGTCTVLADQAGDSNYAAASQLLLNVTIGKAAQSLTFSSAPAIAVNGSGTISAANSAPNSGNPIVYSDLTPDVCAIDTSSLAGATVTGVTAGVCTIAANQSGDANYNAALPATQDVVIDKAAQTLTFGNAPSIAVNGSGTIIASDAAPDSGNPISYASNTPAICSVDGATVTGILAGTCTVSANQAGDSNYLPGSATQSFGIGIGTQSLSFRSIAPTNATVGGPAYIVNAASSAGLPVTLTIDPSAGAVCSISASSISFNAAGTCVIDASQSGDANYAAATPLQQSFAVAKAAQTITFAAQAAQTYQRGGTFAINPLASASSGLGIRYSSLTPAICSVNETVVTMLASGTCTIAADQSGNATTYAAAAQVSQSVAITSIPVRTFTASSPTGSGSITATFVTTDANCTFAAGTSYMRASAVPADTGFQSTQGLANLLVTNCAPGASVTLTITYPQALPASTVYRKYGPSSDNAAPHWYTFGNVHGNVATLALTDGSTGDDDLLANGSITDPGGPAIPGGSAASSVPAPAVSLWAMLAMVIGMAWLARRHSGSTTYLRRAARRD